MTSGRPSRRHMVFVRPGALSTFVCPLAMVLATVAPARADALLPPPPVRLGAIHGVAGWAEHPPYLPPLLGDRFVADLRIVPVLAPEM